MLPEISLKDAASSAIALCGFLFGLYQYWRGQRLQKAKFAVELTDRIYSDEDLQAAWNLIDWKDCELVLPKKFSSDGAVPAKFNHSLSNLDTAMSLECRHILDDHYSDLKEEYRRSPYTEYVAIFDRFFSFTEGIWGFYRSRSIELQHIPHIIYLLDRLDKIKFCNKKIFEEYLAYYDYDRVIYMIKVAHICLNDSGIITRLMVRYVAQHRAASRTTQIRERIKQRLRSPRLTVETVDPLPTVV